MADIGNKNITSVNDLTSQFLLRIEDQLVSIKSNIEIPFQFSKGKRLRPHLYLASYFATTPDLDYLSRDVNQLIDTATGLELLHEASLIHDDILDGAHMRRGKATIHESYGGGVALVVGDLFFAKAVELALDATNSRSSTYVGRKFVHTASKLAEGELHQQYQRTRNPNYVPKVDEYLKFIRWKTASLFGLSCELGALSAGASRSQALSLWGFGVALGMAYQIMDDSLDLFSTEDVEGKDVGNDWVTGKITLPYILGFSEIQKRGLLNSGSRSKDDVAIVIDVLTNCGVLEKTMEYHQKYFEQAQRQLNKLPDNENRLMLQNILRKTGRKTS